MQRIGATIALLGYLWGGLLLPTVHRHGPHDSALAPSLASSACGAAVQGCTHHHGTATPTSIADRAAVPAAGWQGFAPSAHACQELCLLCQLASTSYIAGSGKGRFCGAAHAAPTRPAVRQLPPPSQRRTAGYLRGPPPRVS